MKNFIKEFGDDQSKKKINIKWEPESEWGFEKDIKHLPVQEPILPDDDKSVSFTKQENQLPQQKTIPYVDKTGKQKQVPWVSMPKPQKTVTPQELKEIVTRAVLNMMNSSMDFPPSSNELIEEQKEEIEGIIKEYCNRPGIMSISFREDFDKDEAVVNALIDPTNHNNWIALREELIYKLPYSYKESLHEFASQAWNKHKFV